MFGRMKRIVVTPEKLRTAILIWLRVMPKYVWRRYETYERLAAQKRQSEEDEPKAREEMADYLAERFAAVQWEVTHPEPKNHG